MKLSSKAVIVMAVVLVLAGCAGHSNYENGSYRQYSKTSNFNDDGDYVYSPPKIYRTWINAHTTGDNEVAGSHYRYWVGDPGHWNVPIHTQAGIGADLLGPDQGGLNE